MRAVRKIMPFIFFIMTLGAPAAAALAEQPTVESAHGFLGHVINKQSTKGTQRHETYLSYAGSGCQSRLTSRWGNDQTLLIDWSSVSAVEIEDRSHGTSVYVRGAVQRNGKVEQYFDFIPDSKAMAERMAKAFSFLRAKCDKTKAFGF